MPQDTDGRGVDVTTAAHVLGISPDAVRGRLHRGTLDGTRGKGGHWTVFLQQPPEPEPTDSAQGAPATGEQRKTAGRRQDADRPLYQAIIDRQDAEIGFLRDQFDHSRRELSAERKRADVLHREALGPIQALAAGGGEHHDDTGHDGADEPSDRPGRGGTPAMGQESTIASWWRRLIGRG